MTTINNYTFHSTIAAHPGDYQTRQIFADWLEDQGQCEEAAQQRAIAAVQEQAAVRERKRREQEAREAKYIEARKGVALALGEAFHARIADLYQSKRAEVVYGSGGAEVVDWDAYGKRGYTNPHTGRKQPAKYRNAGARITGYARTGRVVIENSRGTVVARLPLPPQDAVLNGHRGLVGGDLYAVKRQIGGVRFVVRFGPSYTRDGGHRIATGYEQTGVAVEFAVPEDCRVQGRSLWGVFSTDKTTYWEHGDSVADCRREYEAKLALADARRQEIDRSGREQKMARRIARFCPNLVVGHADRKACGFCDAGTNGFLTRHGLADRDTVTAAELRRTGDVQVERVIEMAAKRVARERLSPQS